MMLAPLALLAAAPAPPCLAAPPPATEAGLPLAEAVVRLPPPGLRPHLRTRPLSIEPGPEPGTLRLVGAPSTLAALPLAGIPLLDYRSDHRAPPPAGSYHDAAAMVEALEDLAESCGERCSLEHLGESPRGNPLVALRVDEGNQRIRLLGAHHGDEAISAELVLDVARTWVERDPEPDLELWFVPHVNPDGIDAGSRYNANGIDLNRNYDYAWSAGEYRSGETAFSEPESRAVRTFSLYRGFGMGLSTHGGATNICYVWNYTLDPTPDEALLVDLVDAYAEDCTRPGFYVTNGAAWYITYGDSTDWGYGRLGVLDFTLELSSDKTPPPEEMDAVLDDHRDAVLAFLTTPASVAGTIRSAEDDTPVMAAITPEGGWTRHAAADGSFARWLEPGTWTLTVEAPGYEATEVEVEAVEGETASVEVELQVSGDRLAVRPDPPLVSWSHDPSEIDLSDSDIQDGEVRLVRPGLPEVTAIVSGGTFEIVPSQLEPGPWTLDLPGGVAPNALLVGERSDRVTIDDVVRITEDSLQITGDGFAEGTRAWLLGGAARNLVALDLEGSDETLVLDVTPGLDLAPPVDLLVVSAGAQVSVMDVMDSPWVDTGTPADSGTPPWEPVDTGSRDNLLTVGGGQCGCGAPTPFAASPLPVTIGMMLVRRRRRRRGVFASGGCTQVRSRS